MPTLQIRGKSKKKHHAHGGEHVWEILVAIIVIALITAIVYYMYSMHRGVRENPEDPKRADEVEEYLVNTKNIFTRIFYRRRIKQIKRAQTMMQDYPGYDWSVPTCVEAKMRGYQDKTSSSI
ncbi:hypothetical protein BDV96DRAFT_605292 [Lophiotrema nucula]|uniref:Uncharacterized protein n=1 Tax=Lophiotrema nucula TaxID=690887 RepID=A0A6A5YNZ2_9PLEO|nr:hypothetical protein BDV96DRAFT_605292 [Lophiotrema nucula]